MTTTEHLMKVNPFLTVERAESIVNWARGTTPLAELDAGRKFWIATKLRPLTMLRRMRATVGLRRDDMGRIVGYNTPKVVKFTKRERVLVEALRQVAPDHPVLSQLAA